MKAVKRLVILCIATYALAVTATAQTTWKLSKNLLETNNQISFNQGANGAWYFLESSSFKHLPITYQFLPFYSLPCQLNPSLQIKGTACWQNPIPDSEGNIEPIIGANFTYATQSVGSPPLSMPPRSVWMHPSAHGLVVIGWKSPITGVVNVAGFFSDLDPNCGNGVIWSVDKGSSTLTTGTIPNGGPAQTFSLTGVSVSAGQVLYFVVDPNGDYFCDSTGVDVTISESK